MPGAAEGFSASGAPQPKTDAERWILARLDRCIVEVHAQYANYRFDLVSQALYEFAWNDYCDWFLELAKPALQGDDVDAANSTRHTLLHALESLLRLLHPLIPFVTEEIWQHVKPFLGISAESISLQVYPEMAGVDYAQSEADIEWLKAAAGQLRRIRSEMNIAPSKAVPLLIKGGSAQDQARIERFRAQLSFLARLESIAKVGADEPAAAAAVLGELTLLIPLAGLIDLGAERARLDKEIKRVEIEIGKCNGKLGSETFVQNAPAAVVEQERQRLSDWNVQLDGLRQQRDKLAAA